MCRYGMLASISTVVKGDLEQHLEPIVRRMMETLTSEEGVKVSTGGNWCRK